MGDEERLYRGPALGDTLLCLVSIHEPVGKGAGCQYYRLGYSGAANSDFPWSQSQLRSEALLIITVTIILSQLVGCIFIYIAASAPNKASLGATNGLAQMMVSVMRTFGPAAANSLFALSIRHQYLGGWLVYCVLLAVASGSVLVATTLPHKAWRDSK